MEWNKQKQNFNGHIKKTAIPVNCVETDLQHIHDKQECYHNLLGGLAS